MLISIPTFQGIRPKVAEDMLGQFEAQTAENCCLYSGKLESWYNYLLTQRLNNVGIIRKIYLYQDEYWLEWEADVDVVPAPISGDTAGKIYFTGAGIPKKTNEDEAVTGSGAMPINFYPLAVPTPKHALTATPGGGGTGDDRNIAYRWTVITSWSEESFPSPASTVCEAKNGETVALTGMTMVWQAGTAYEAGDFVFKVGDEGGTYLFKCVTAGTSGAGEPTWIETVDKNTIDNTVLWRCYENNLSAKYIYRLNTGEEYANYEYVASIAVAATTYNDTKTDSELSSVCPSLSKSSGGAADADWDPPLDALRGICYLGNGILLAFTGKDIYASVAYRPWAWPISYSQSVPYDIVAITPIGDNQAVVTTNEKPFLLTGVAPSSISVDPMAEENANLSKRATVRYSGGCVYPGTDGLRMVMNGQNTNLTKDYFKTEEWAQYYPASMHAVIHDGKYFGFYQSGSNEGGIVIDLETGEIDTLDFYTFAAFVDTQTDTLYFLRSADMALYREIWTNPDAATTSGKATQFSLNATGALASIVQPDYPRNVVLFITDGNASLTALQVTVTGTLATGETGQTEVFTATAAGAHAGSKAFAHIDSITVDSETGGEAADKLDVGYGVLFGLGNSIDDSGDVIKVNIDMDDAAVASQTISTTYDTISFSTAPDAAHDYEVFYATD